MKWFLYILFLFISIQKGDIQECNDLIQSGVEAMHGKEHAQSLELLTKAKTIAEDNNWHREQFLAINNIGANYYSMLDYGEALDNYLEAYTIAIKELDEDYEMVVLNNIAILYSKEKQFDKAEEYFEKAYQIAKQKGDGVKIGMYAVNLGLVNNEQNELEKAKIYLDEAINLLKERPDILMQAEIALADNLFREEKYEASKKIIEELLPQLKDKAYQEHRLELFILLSKIAESENRIGQAIEHANKALRETASLDNKIIVFEQLSKLQIKNNDFLKAINAKDSILKAKDELTNKKNSRLFETNKVKFEVQTYQSELLENQQRLTSQRKTIYLIAGLSVLIIALIAWALRNSYIKNKQRKALHKRTQEIISLELEKEKSDNLLLEKQLKEKETRALLEQEKLKNEIENKNRKLAAKALHLSNRNELIEDIIKSLSRQLEVSKNPKLRAYIKQLKNHLQTDAEWESFLTHFEEVNHGFLKSLKEKHANLTSNDIRFLSYMYMNLSIKEISLLLNITPEACRKRKERICKKIGLDKETELYDYISVI